ncbi:unnamed protein product [Citrullus colocynthis]|uniref:Uncharacterized protein n=1 Tax=Citrullus colocynthis TaxID=252529 RepID=A0ABP0YVY2_9ROSI
MVLTFKSPSGFCVRVWVWVWILLVSIKFERQIVYSYQVCKRLPPSPLKFPCRSSGTDFMIEEDYTKALLASSYVSMARQVLQEPGCGITPGVKSKALSPSQEYVVFSKVKHKARLSRVHCLAPLCVLARSRPLAYVCTFLQPRACMLALCVSCLIGRVPPSECTMTIYQRPTPATACRPTTARVHAFCCAAYRPWLCAKLCCQMCHPYGNGLPSSTVP